MSNYQKDKDQKEVVGYNVEHVLGIANRVLCSSHLRSLLCGTYSDGTPRNITDAINGEYLSPKQKNDMYSKKRTKHPKTEKNYEKGGVVYISSYEELKEAKKKKKKKKEQKKKKGKSYGLDKDILFF